MARPPRRLATGSVYHVVNRGSRKGPLFDGPDDYDAFERLVVAARSRFAVRIIAYCLMLNHFHFLLWPIEALAISRFMHWLTGTHASHRRRVTQTRGEGAVYQARFWAHPMYDDLQLLAAWRYIERNPIRAGLVERAEDWRWSSASLSRNESDRLTLDLGPCPRPVNWLDIVNASYCNRFIDYE
jgi:putative transposase